MKKINLLLLAIGITLLPANSLVRASEVDDILKEINGGSKKSESSEPSTSVQETSSRKTESSIESENGNAYAPSRVQPSSTPKPKKKIVRETSVPRQQAAPRPSITVWNPRDKLPKEITGQGVAGNFVIYGTSSQGNLILIPAEDAENPFARQFWVVNRTFAGGSPNVLVPMGQRQMVQVSASQPLIFIGRGILPGVYNVQAQ